MLMAPFTRLKVRSLTLCAALLGLSVSAEAFDDQPHILIMPGHTSSVEWDDSARAYIPTCQYKSLNGARPRRGEACDGSPRLAISVEDLRDLKYITSTQDKNELVQRVYERFDNILFVTAPDLQFDYGDSPERFEAGPISVRHPRVPPSDYDKTRRCRGKIGR